MVERKVGSMNSDYGHRDMTAAGKRGQPKFDDKGKPIPNVPVRYTGPYADNTMAPPEHLNENEGSLLDRLHEILNADGIDDIEIKDDVRLSKSGYQKVGAALGISPHEVMLMIGALATKLKKDERLLADEYNDHINEEEDRFTYEEDYMGNITIHDTSTGRDVYLRGEDASKLRDELEHGNEQAILADYLSIMEDEDEDCCDDDDIECPACGGQGNILGSMGYRKHCRCRDCGIDFSRADTKSKSLDEGFKSSYEVGDRVETPCGTGTIVSLDPRINETAKLKVKLDNPELAGEDGKYKDTFIFTTFMIKHVKSEVSFELGDRVKKTGTNLYGKITYLFPDKEQNDGSRDTNGLGGGARTTDEVPVEWDNGTKGYISPRFLEKVVQEKWEGNPKIEKTNQWANYTIDELEQKKKTLINKEERTPAESSELKQINFAIRAKRGWKGDTKESLNKVGKVITETSIAPKYQQQIRDLYKEGKSPFTITSLMNRRYDLGLKTQDVIELSKGMDDDIHVFENVDEKTVGTYNFPWKFNGEHGTATAKYGKTPGDLTIIHIRDSEGDAIDADPVMKKAIEKAAFDFIGKA